MLLHVNTNYNYEKGKFSIIPFDYYEKNHELTIKKRLGIFPGMLETRTFEIVLINKLKPSGLDFISKPDVIVKYDGNQQSIIIK